MMTITEYLQRCVEEGAFPGAAWQIGGREGILEAGTAGVLGDGLGAGQGGYAVRSGFPDKNYRDICADAPVSGRAGKA